MKHITDIDNLTKATRRREFDDGLVDFIYAVVFLILSIFCWFFFSSIGMKWYITALVNNREITLVGMLLLFSLFVLLTFGSRRVIDRIRQSSIWKDRGFVKSLRWQVRWPIQLAASIVFISIILSAFWLMLKGLITADTVLRALVSSVGIASGIVFLGGGIDLGLQRYIYVGICGILMK